MPAALRIRLRPPSHPTRYSRPQRPAVGQLDVDPGLVLREPRHLTSAMDRHLELADPAGQDALDVVLPEPERVGVPGGKLADVQTGPRRTGRPGPPVPPPGTDRRFRADRGSRWSVRAVRLRASREGPGRRAARRSRRPPPPAPTRPPASARSDLLRRSPPHAPSYATLRPDSSTTTRPFASPISGGSGLRPAIMRHDPGLAASPPVGYKLEVERVSTSSFHR